MAREETPPTGVEALEWLLLTSLPASTFEQAMTVVSWYGVRWCIEIYQTYCLYKSVFYKLMCFITGLIYPDSLSHALFA